MYDVHNKKQEGTDCLTHTDKFVVDSFQVIIFVYLSIYDFSFLMRSILPFNVIIFAKIKQYYHHAILSYLYY